jgi:hypothetical protein
VTALKLAFCSHDAAKYATSRWHYSRSMPKSKLVRTGVWEDERFVGCVIFGVGANRHLASQFGLPPTEVCELTRVALAPGRSHPTSKVVAIALRLLKRQSPGLKLVVSFADLAHGHVGTLYQAGGWYYVGNSDQSYLKIHGRIVHPRTVYDRYGPGGQSVAWLRTNVDPRAERVAQAAKLRYVYPLDKSMRKKLEGIALAYPKRGRSNTSDAPGDQPGEDGAAPIRPLQPTAAHA